MENEKEPRRLEDWLMPSRWVLTAARETLPMPTPSERDEDDNNDDDDDDLVALIIFRVDTKWVSKERLPSAHSTVHNCTIPARYILIELWWSRSLKVKPPPRHLAACKHIASSFSSSFSSSSSSSTSFSSLLCTFLILSFFLSFFFFFFFHVHTVVISSYPTPCVLFHTNLTLIHSKHSDSLYQTESEAKTADRVTWADLT